MLGFVREHLPSFRQSTQNVVRRNSTAFGFSILATGAMAILTTELGSPNGLEVLLWAVGGVASFTAADLLASEGFRRHLSSEPADVVAHASSISFLSVTGGLGAVYLLVQASSALFVWPLATFLGSTVFVLFSGLELTVAEAIVDD